MTETIDPIFLQATPFVDCDSEQVQTYTKQVLGEDLSAGQSDKERVLKLFYAIRDGIKYDPYQPYADLGTYRASTTVDRQNGFCVAKAALLAACARFIGVPARPGYADVRNHMASPRMIEAMKTDLFIWHSYCELYLNGKWVKATPAFNLVLCEKLGLKPLDFDGENDSLFHDYDQSGNRHMEYVQDRGTYADVPAQTIVRAFRETYPGLFSDESAGGTEHLDGDFESEAVSM